MAKRMLIDATHAEETRVVVLDGNRLEDFDLETATKRQLKGNIYLAKVVRVEPSLQAAFVEYGGNRHGFLAFSEIHPDYYQIPVADRQRLLELQAEEARLEEEEDDLELALSQAAGQADAEPPAPAPEPPEPWAIPALPSLEAQAEPVAAAPEPAAAAEPAAEPWAVAAQPALIAPTETIVAESAALQGEIVSDDQPDSDDLDMFGSIPEEAPPETIGGGDADVDSGEERRERRFPPRFLRNYHIQEVIHRRQILLVQVVKEERGTKGAALTTYLSLAGRFSVLMPNSPRGGGISRKITSAADRRRLKEVMVELDIPKGMGLIVRTAGAQRPKPEIKRDCEYLLRLWDDIREHTLKSIAPALIYEEASLIKRAIRDVYSREVDTILVDGEEGYRAAHEFMRMLMPTHARKVEMWPPHSQPLFSHFGVEAQLDAMMQPTVQLRSGGYLVINQAEALVAIDVNSGRSTRERNVEETALRTNLEAADEVARQLRLRDLAGLIVIDFIDMESKRHNAMVERRLKEALKDDRARIQVGHISHFGLMEMSRQRLRPSLEETTLITCPHCNGTGHVRGTESAALHVLRGVEEEAGKRRSAEVIVHVATAIALYILNHKRERLNEIERRYGMRVIIAADDSMIAPRFRIERLRTLEPGQEPRFVTPDAPRAAQLPPPVADLVEELEDEEDDDADAEDGAGASADGEDAQEAERRRRRRRRRRGRRDDEAPPVREEAAAPLAIPAAPVREEEAAEGDDDGRGRRSRRGRGRRRRDDGDMPAVGVPGAEQPDLVPAYAGPTPADPFGGAVFDIFDAMEQAEINASSNRRPQSGRRDGRRDRPRWQPPAWASAAFPPMLAAEPAADRPDRGPPVEAWALPSRPFLLRRDRHQPRWRQGRGPRNGEAEQAQVETVVVPLVAGPPPSAAPEPAVAQAEPVWASPAKPPLTVEPVAAPPEPVVSAPVVPEPVVSEPVVAEPVAAEPVPEPIAAEPAPVEAVPAEPAPAEPVAAEPANDVVSGPVIQPIVIGSENAPPAERKRGWWRRG
jgi:ribonuclease E